MTSGSGTAETRVTRQLRAIVLTATGTLATYTVIVMLLPAADFVFDVLPSPGRYANLARAAAVLLSALIAYRELTHRYRTARMDGKDIRPDGLGLLLLGLVLVLGYIACARLALGAAGDVVRFILYVSLMVLLSFGFVRLAKKAYDFAKLDLDEAESRKATTRRTAELKLEIERMRGVARRKRGVDGERAADKSVATPASGAARDASIGRFVAAFFAALASAVAALSAATEIFDLLPPVIDNAIIATALSAMVATFAIGSSYTAQFLERNLAKTIGESTSRLIKELDHKNTVVAGIAPVLVGIACIVGYLFIDSALGGAPSPSIWVELALIVIRVAIFTLITFGLWRLGAARYAASRRS